MKEKRFACQYSFVPKMLTMPCHIDASWAWVRYMDVTKVEGGKTDLLRTEVRSLEVSQSVS